MTLIKIETRLPYNPKLKERTRELRKNMTEPEKKLWFGFFRKINNGEIKLPLSYQTSPSMREKARNKQGGVVSIEGKFKGEKIRILRQRPIDNFIVDFYISKLKLVIEIDGDSHFDEHGKVYDRERTQILEGLGLKVIRFTNEEVMKNFDGVCESILNNL